MENTNLIKKDEEVIRRSKSEITVKLLEYLKPYKFKSFIVILLMIFVMISSIVNPLLLKIAIDKYVVNKDVTGLILIGIILIVLNLLAWGLSKIRWNMITSITNNILVNIRHELYSHIQYLSFDFFDGRPVGKILSRVVSDVNSLKNLFSQSIQSLIPQLLNLLCVAIIMFFLNYKLALASVALLPVLGIAMFCIEIYSRRRWEIYRNKRSNLNGFTHEDFSGIKIVQGFAKEKGTENNFKSMVKELSNSFVRAVMLNDFFWPLVELSWGAGTLIVFAVGYKLVINNEIQIGTLIAFSMYVGMFWRPIMNLSSFYNTLITNFSAADRIFDILDMKPVIKNEENAKEIGKIQGVVEFKDVNFSYDENAKVLKDINFKVNKGEKIALVGATGAGKTTIVSLLSRFYDPTSGEVLVDGKNIKNVDLESLRSQMGIMLQDTFLFSTTIMENIRYGRLDATDEEVINAAKAVNAHEFILKLENGYNTEVNERGTRLSLGQRQLVSFARALLANPRILILDEATSNIDTETEKLVQEGIEKLLHGRTSFVVAHRLSTIRDCDKIMVINDGRIEEVGSHNELLNNKGSYYDLYMTQYKFLNEGA
ncbi:ABC transporter ATP-binding protein [Clostridium tertium]|jgi:ATP-binding cassette, subfamily B, multidrug efflux pump|uniref:ABC transporter ATP-binding protein n=1 Tax=Clostridium TaxID=1485 RepID=UPI00115805E4|nr:MULTISPECIES: ABC transporter ATP-binding protein [Clostridium]MBS5305600.1 ABC transporter ATP-binding protein [Clostridium sp.]MDB1923725.1 ABC transporter ATP-binding protein [Clostridium tertium]MDB1925961.1 ABC transporter ATP-binding protein [Clostridium tertium]MDB1929249.1 ABC transporter ATP-binding protein [Clostridium tertium]MDB1932788.1 ABC transporter ATP-binding protein [Clostridium tertium]